MRPFTASSASLSYDATWALSPSLRFAYLTLTSQIRDQSSPFESSALLKISPVVNLQMHIEIHIESVNFTDSHPQSAPVSFLCVSFSPLFGLSETSSPLSSFVFLALHFAGWRWGIDQKQNGWAVLPDPPVLKDFKAGWGCECVPWRRVCVCVTCMYMQIYVYLPESLCSFVPTSLPLSLSFYLSALCTLECLLRLAMRHTLAVEVAKRICNPIGIVSFAPTSRHYLLSQNLQNS